MGGGGNAWVQRNTLQGFKNLTNNHNGLFPSANTKVDLKAENTDMTITGLVFVSKGNEVWGTATVNT